jgi:hypothetical protein
MHSGDRRTNALISESEEPAYAPIRSLRQMQTHNLN